MQVESRFGRFWTQLLRAWFGLPDYDAYLAHCREHHPERTPPDCATFYREREAARYARGRNRCC